MTDVATHQTISWIALPNGKLDEDRYSLSVFVSPRLTTDSVSMTLTDFPDFVDWPSTLQSLEFVIGSHDGTADHSEYFTTSAGTSEYWTALFPPSTPVRSFQFTDRSSSPILSYPVGTLLDHVHDQYGNAAGRFPDDLPSHDDMADPEMGCEFRPSHRWLAADLAMNCSTKPPTFSVTVNRCPTHRRPMKSFRRCSFSVQGCGPQHPSCHPKSSSTTSWPRLGSFPCCFDASDWSSTSSFPRRRSSPTAARSAPAGCGPARLRGRHRRPHGGSSRIPGGNLHSNRNPDRPLQISSTAICDWAIPGSKPSKSTSMARSLSWRRWPTTSPPTSAIPRTTRHPEPDCPRSVRAASGCEVGTRDTTRQDVGTRETTRRPDPRQRHHTHGALRPKTWCADTGH